MNGNYEERNKQGMIVNSDRDGRYLLRKMKNVIKTFKLRKSMSHADDAYDNGWAESFWGG